MTIETKILIFFIGVFVMAALSTNQSVIIAQNEQTKDRLNEASKKLDEIINATSFE